MHFIEAFLADRRNIHSSDHKMRDNAVFSVAELKPIYKSYATLKDASFNARYMPPAGLGYTEAVIDALANTHLANIQAQIGRHIRIA